MEDSKQMERVGAVLVCGAGIAGIQASLDLAESGFKVYLLDSSAAIGGQMAQLDKTYPTGDCATCILSPRLVECARNKNIDILTLAEVEGISGSQGSFKVKIRQNPRYVDSKKCDACGNCEQVCPVDLPSDFECGTGTRKAVYRPYPQAIPNVFAISKAVGQSPCKVRCPAGVNIQGFIALTAAGKFLESYELLRQRCPLPAACGRICRHPCQDGCNRAEMDEAVSICDLERFIGDHVQNNPDLYPALMKPTAFSDRRVAIIGGGPAGLTAANDLVLMGYRVTLFEAKPDLGGMLRYGIPEFRLPKSVLDKEIRQILRLGVEVKTGAFIANPRDLLLSNPPNGKTSESGFDAVLVAAGAWLARKSGIPGEDASGVWKALNFLCEVNAGTISQAGRHVLVIGSSEIAIDAARCARRLPGVQTVLLACMESAGELRAIARYMAEASEEGVEFHHGLGPTRINVTEGRVDSVTFRACTSVFDQHKRFDPLFDDSAISTLSADTVIVDAGRSVDSYRFGLETRPGGRILTDLDTLATSIKGVFAGGDAVLGPSSMAEAMAQGHRAAESIDAYIRESASIRSTESTKLSPAVPARSKVVKLASNPKPDIDPQNRVPTRKASTPERLRGNMEDRLGYSPEEANAEAKRCLSCNRCSECMECVKACAADAIMHDEQPSGLDIEVGSVILALGTEESKASLRRKFGLGRYRNVISSLQFERMLSSAGPNGHIRRPSDGAEPTKIAFIQCAGRVEGGQEYCSSVCCMNTSKQALSAREHSGESQLEAWIFCREPRGDSYLDKAGDEKGITYLRAFPSRVEEITANRNIRLLYRDRQGAEQEQEFDLLVLSAGVQVSAGVKELAARLGVELNRFGFAQTQRFSPLATSRPGIYLAGTFQEPKDILESVSQASGAAASAMSLLTGVRGTMTQRREYPWERDVSDEPPRIGAFVCRCGHNIASVVDVELVARKASQLPGVCHAEALTYTCSDSNQQHIREMIKAHRLNRLVVASCSSRTHEILFQDTLRESGLNQHLFAMTNIRDQCSWVHRDNPAAATAKAADLVSMVVARARNLRAFPLMELPVTPSALILGGGLGGLTAALSVAEQGFKVHLVERQAVLGGVLRNIHSTLEQINVQAELKYLISRVLFNKNIRVYRNSTLVRTSGQVGNFTTLLNVAGGEEIVHHGVLIVATGGHETPTDKFLHGRNSHVMTQSKLESALSEGHLPPELGRKENPTVVMIQCVESRDEHHPYCSRVCCAEALKNALEIKRRLPESRVVILNRDIRTYGFRDAFFRKASSDGIVFVRYSESSEPIVIEEKENLKVSVHDPAVDRSLVFDTDLLVLSTGISPAASNPELSNALRSALTPEGFFTEAHPKLRPVDLSNEGEFVCGLAHSPRFVDETIAQAQAAAGRASRILSKAQLEIMGQVSYVNSADCRACATCIKVCLYGAPMINALGKAEIQGAKCLGCGGCVAACPARAISMQHQEGRTVSAMLEEMLAAGGQP